MRIGVFCVYDNPLGDYRRCFADQAEMVMRAEALGFEEAWVAEHHFDANAVSPSIMPLLAHLTGTTKTIRLGSAAILLPFRNPIEVAEDVATLDVLSGGRFDFGVAKGGPFPAQNKHFNVAKESARGMMLEALELIQRLLREERVTFKGVHYACEDLALVPRPVQHPMPTFIASTTEDAIRIAAEKDYGVMGASLASNEGLARIVELYRATAPDKDPRLAVSRFYFAAPTREAALAEAVPSIRRFVERMRQNFLALNPQGGGPNEEVILERSLIGSYDEVTDKIMQLEAATGLRSLLLKPASLEPAKWITALDGFAQHIRPVLEKADQQQPGLVSTLE